MLRVMLVLGVLVLVPAVIVFWRTRERSIADSPAGGGGRTVSSRSLGTSTLSHGGPSRTEKPTVPGRELNVSESGPDPKRDR